MMFKRCPGCGIEIHQDRPSCPFCHTYMGDTAPDQEPEPEEQEDPQPPLEAGTCPACGGDGLNANWEKAASEPCPTCGGEGVIRE